MQQLLKSRLLKKTLKISLGSIVSVILLTIITLVILFKNLDHFKTRIDKKVYELSGYHLAYAKLNTSFNRYLEPQLIIDQLAIYPKTSEVPLLKIKQIALGLSYRSLIQLTPIFSTLKIEGSDIAIEYDKADNLLLNKQIVTNLNTPSKSEFDLDSLILVQQNLQIKQVNLILYDSKHYPRTIHINNINIGLQNVKGAHQLTTNLKLGNTTTVELSANWQGNKLWDIRKWQSGTINLHTLNKLGYLIKLNTQIQDGTIKLLKTKFDSNKQNFAKYGENIQNFTDLAGAIKIEQNSPGYYEIDGKNLTLNTKSGYLFKQAHLKGTYHSIKGGTLELKTINLEGINSILEVYPITEKLGLSGTASLNLNWESSFSDPQNIHLMADIGNLALKSNESNIPGINNVNAKLDLSTKETSAEISLNNSYLVYPKQLYQPIKIDSFNSKIKLIPESANKIKVTWKDTHFKTNDFTLNSTGKFISESNFIDLQANIDNLNLARVSNYLPRSLPKSAIKTVKESLTAGKLNGQLTLYGSLNQFPFKNESQGVFKFNAAINNGSYRFMPNWNAINKINAKLQMDNQNVNLTVNSGQIGAVSLLKSTIQVPSWSHPHELLVKGQAKGTTIAYLDYLKTTPFATEVSQADNQISIKGNSQLRVQLKLPFKNPGKLQLDGKFIPENNQIILKSTPILVNDINGNVNFSQKGIEPGKIYAKSLNSSFQISLNSKEVNVYSPDLNYSSIASLASPTIEPVISGAAPTTVSYQFKDKSLTARSQLQGVKIQAVTPLSKEESELGLLQLNMQELGNQTKVINLNYGNQLYARANLSSQMSLNRLNIAMGTTDYRLSNQLESAVVTAKINSKKFSFTDWAKFAMKLTSSQEEESAISKKTEESKTTNSSTTTTTKNRLYPIQLEINSGGFWAENYNLDGGKLTATILPESITANINTPDIKGQFSYFPEENYLNINMQRLLFSSTNFESTPINTQHTESQAIQNRMESLVFDHNTESNQLLQGTLLESQIKLVMESDVISKSGTKPVNYPDIDLNIDSFYYQNHYFGSVKGSIYTESNSLYLESMAITNQAATTKISMSDNCLGCANEYVAIIVHSDINDFGLLLTKLDQGNIFSKGKGKFIANVGWQGGLADFSPAKIRGQANLDIVKGQLVQVNPGLFGSLLGVISISNYATSFNPMGLNGLFGKGFDFDTLKTSLYLSDQTVKIEKFEMIGPIAAVNTFGNVDFNNNQIDTFLTLEPRLGGTIATTAGIVTLNPFVGMFVYAAEYLVGEPINKALAVSFHITGKIESPTMTQTKIDKQIINNFTSSLNIFNNIKQPLGNNN